MIKLSSDYLQVENPELSIAERAGFSKEQIKNFIRGAGENIKPKNKATDNAEVVSKTQEQQKQELDDLF